MEILCVSYVFPMCLHGFCKCFRSVSYVFPWTLYGYPKCFLSVSMDFAVFLKCFLCVSVDFGCVSLMFSFAFMCFLVFPMWGPRQGSSDARGCGGAGDGRDVASNFRISFHRFRSLSSCREVTKTSC